MQKDVEYLHNKNGIPKTDITDEMLEDYYKSRVAFIKEKTYELNSSTSFDSARDHKCEYHFRIFQFKYHPTSKDLFISLTCPVCNKILFDDRPYKFFQFDLIYQQLQKKNKILSERELINISISDTFYSYLRIYKELAEQDIRDHLSILTQECPIHNQKYTTYFSDIKKTVCQLCKENGSPSHCGYLLESQIATINPELHLKKFDTALYIPLTHLVNVANRIHKILIEVYENLDSNPICTKDEILTYLELHREYYVTYSLDFRCLAILDHYVTYLYGKGMRSSESHNIINNILQFFNLIVPTINEDFIKRPKDNNDIKILLTKAKEVYQSALTYNPDSDKINQIKNYPSDYYNP